VIHEIGAHRGHPYMVLEYLEGQTLRQWLNDRAAAAGGPARVPPARAVELMLPVVRALAYAHDQGIVHRDLKPENVMLTTAGVIKVLDFGIARLVEGAPGFGGEPAASAANSTLAGTLPYMAPEQVTLAAIDHRVDVWAAGIMLFELVAGAHPVLATTMPLIAAIGDEDSPMPSASERVPELGQLGPIIDRCLIKQPAHRTASARVLLAELEALAPGRRALAIADGGSPFAGLAAFQVADAGRFFGRDRDIELVVAELRSRPMVAVAGPSGAGKSSLVRAGVIPALKRSGEGWDAHIVRPGREPLGALAGILAHLDSSPGDATGEHDADRAVRARLHAEPGYLGARLRARATSKRRRIALFVDQLEELYTLGVSAHERLGFLACLAAIADDATSPLRVLVSMRSDFLDRLTEDRRLLVEITRGLVLLPPMDRDGMREALVRPVEASEYRFESPALIDRMLDAVAETSGALPLLQFTAARLWERRDRDSRQLTEASYEQLGGVAGALAMHADAVLTSMSAAQQSVARAVLERLVTPERTRALVSASELHALQSGPAVDDVVQHLAAMRLVVIERSADGADHTVELIHESLIAGWPTLVRWLDDHEDDAAMLGRLRAAAREWARSGHAAGLLWTGGVADAARAWRERYRGELALVEQRYLAAMLAAVDRARGVRRRLFGAILSIAVVVAIAMGWLAWQRTQSRREAIAQAWVAAAEAMRARDATRMAAIRALSDDPTTQLALLREIEDRASPPPGALQEAQRLLYAGVALVVWTSPAGISSASFSPDGRRIVTATDDRAVRLWNADGTGEPVVVHASDHPVRWAAFAPDGRVLSVLDDTALRISRSDGSEPIFLRGHTAEARSARFSPDGQRIASASRDSTVRVWRADGRGEPLVLRGHDGEVRSAAFSADGRRIASASDDRTVRIWNADGTGQPLILRGHDEAVVSVAFSPDGRRIASASDDRTVRVWNADGTGPPVILRGHDDKVSAVAFSPDGRYLVSASWDKTVRLWSVEGSELLVLHGHQDRVLCVEFSPDGKYIASASVDKTLRLWSAQQSTEPPVLHGHSDGVSSAAFSPDGLRIVSASNDKTVRVWSAVGRSQPLVLRGHDATVTSAEFSPDGQRIISASYDRTIRVWRADGSGEPIVLRGHDAAVRSASFSPDGQRIASASSDRTVRVWRADGSGEPIVLRGHGDTVDSVAFSRDGRRIVSASWDGTIRVWSADGSGEPVALRGHTDAIRAATFSPDGQRIVSASTDKTVRVWSADGRGSPIVLRGHTDWVLWAEFSPDGRRIVSASRDKTIRIWPADGIAEPPRVIDPGGSTVLSGHDLSIAQARFSPDGERIVSASIDHTVRIWHLAPIALDDTRLWAATGYCMPVERRIELLAAPRAQAERDRQRCLERVTSIRR